MIDVVLVHGLGRTPLSMKLLAGRLTKAGFSTHAFGYCAAIESFESCKEKLKKFVSGKCGENFFVVGHSLGSVLLRSAIPELRHKPKACFFLGPPTKACRAARFFGTTIFYRILAGDMGKKLGDEKFMESVPVPNIPTTVYAGTAGPRNPRLPHGNEENDGILSVSETHLPNCRLVKIRALHSFIMNDMGVAKDMLEFMRKSNANERL